MVCCIQVSARLAFRTFDVKSGISDNYVQSILRDRYGFMWFGTINGLSRYDGYQCRNYTTMQLGTYNNCINFVKEDASGNIWIQTPQAYLCYNRELDELNKDIHSRLSHLGIEATHVDMLEIDCEQNLWCVADDMLYYYVFNGSGLRRLRLPDKQLLQVVSRSRRSFLLFDDGDLLQVDWQSGQLRKVLTLALPSFGEHCMYMDTQYRLWIYTTYSSSVLCYDTENCTFFPVQEKELLKNDFVKSIVDDGDGNIWMGTNSQGIYILPKNKSNFISIERNAENPFSLPSSHINCLYKDSREIMWIGTTKQGVVFTCLNNTFFEVCHMPQQEDISCFSEDSDGHLWVGFDGKGLVCIDERQKLYRSFNTDNSSIPSDLIINSYLGTDGRLWFGSYGSGLFYKEKDSNDFYPLRFGIERKELPLKHVRHFIKDKYDNLWIGTFMHGLYRLDDSGKLTGYTRENSCLHTNSITGLATSADSSLLYVGTSTGLYKVDVQTCQMDFLCDKDRKGSLLDKIHVNCLYCDSRGMLWIGSRDGIRVYDEKQGSLLHLSGNDGLSHAYIRGIVEDLEGNIWLTTDHGITHIVAMANPVEGQPPAYNCYPYFEEDGLGNIHFCNYSVYCSRSGNILMGGTGKYLKITPNMDKYQSVSHKVIFTAFYLANQRMDVGTKTPDGRALLKKNIQLSDEIAIDYSDYNFALDVSAMDYGIQHKLHFAYRLGTSGEWIRLEGNKIYFSKLSPGTYELQVKVDGTYGKESPVSSLIIRVHPPFYLSGVAYILYVLLLFLLGAFVIWRLNVKHRQMLKQQKHDMEVKQQLEMDEAKMRFFTNVSHDLRTPLSLIITPLERLLGSERGKVLHDDLQLMHRNATILLNEVNQLLDFQKLDQQKTQLSLSYGDLIDFMKGICTPFESLSQKHGIALQLQLPTYRIEFGFDRAKMQRIMFNLLSNAIKYNRKNGSITVAVDKIQTSQGEEYARIIVADSGIGIKDGDKEKVFDRFFQVQDVTFTYMGSGIGLHIVKEYVSLHKGKITVNDNQPHGSVFTVLLPLTRIGQVAVSDNGETASEQNHSAQFAPGRQNASLLVVEDNDDFRTFLVNTLKEHYHVLEAANGKQALEMLACEQVSIVISDVMMPVMDGIELCRKIKTDILYSHIPIILLTARTTEENILDGLKEGADEYVVKPFNIDFLLLRIRKLLEWTQRNREKFNTIDISPSEITVSMLDEQLIEKAIRIVEENMDNSEFSVEEFSETLGLSRSGLYKKLMQITGRSPLEFIRILRLKRGKKLLEDNRQSISQVAYQVGFSPKQFAKFFKEEFGKLPSEYKNERTS